MYLLILCIYFASKFLTLQCIKCIQFHLNLNKIKFVSFFAAFYYIFPILPLLVFPINISPKFALNLAVIKIIPGT